MEGPNQPLTLRDLWREVVDELFSLDRGLPWTVARLFVAPAATVRGYVERRDPRVTRPVRYFVLASAALTAALFALRPRFEALGAIRPGTPEAMLADTAIEHLLLINAVGIAAAALALRLMFARRRPSLVECAVVAAYFAGHMTLVNSAGTVLIGLTGSRLLSTVVGVAMLAWGLWYWASYFGGRPLDWLRAFLALALAQSAVGALFLLAARTAGLAP